MRDEEQPSGASALEPVPRERQPPQFRAPVESVRDLADRVAAQREPNERGERRRGRRGASDRSSDRTSGGALEHLPREARQTVPVQIQLLEVPQRAELDGHVLEPVPREVDARERCARRDLARDGRQRVIAQLKPRHRRQSADGRGDGASEAAAVELERDDDATERDDATFARIALDRARRLGGGGGGVDAAAASSRSRGGPRRRRARPRRRASRRRRRDLGRRRPGAGARRDRASPPGRRPGASRATPPRTGAPPSS